MQVVKYTYAIDMETSSSSETWLPMKGHGITFQKTWIISADVSTSYHL